ncbi:MAG: hypothetical protein AAF611_06920 [Bacteroidota bacterium]
MKKKTIQGLNLKKIKISNIEAASQQIGGNLNTDYNGDCYTHPNDCRGDESQSGCGATDPKYCGS